MYLSESPLGLLLDSGGCVVCPVDILKLKAKWIFELNEMPTQAPHNSRVMRTLFLWRAVWEACVIVAYCSFCVVDLKN